jgi:hypothetical protein
MKILVRVTDAYKIIHEICSLLDHIPLYLIVIVFGDFPSPLLDIRNTFYTTLLVVLFSIIIKSDNIKILFFISFITLSISYMKWVLDKHSGELGT